jgi:MFS family permease
VILIVDETMLATISEPISSSLDAFSKLSWIITMFPIGSSVSQPLSGHLSDIFGRRNGLIVCYLLFAIGTLICGLSEHSLGLFLCGRLIQGLGGGALASITSFIESDLVPLDRRALIEGIGNIACGSMQALGGVYGGVVTKYIGWKWTFLIQVPVIVVNGALVLVVVKIPRDKNLPRGQSIDYLGCLLMLCAITLFQYGMNAGSTESWSRPGVITALILAAATFGVFIFWDSVKAKNPVIPLRLLIQRTVAASQLSFFFTSAATITLLYYVPIYLHVLGNSNEGSGLRFIPYAVTFGLGSFMTGLIVKMTARYYHINFVIQATSITGAAFICTLAKNTPAWAPFVYLALIGAGFGGAYVTRLMGILSSVDNEKQAVIQASAWAISSAGSTVGIAASSAIFQRLSLGRIRDILVDHPDLMDKLMKSFDVLSMLDSSEKAAAIDVYVASVRAVFLLALVELVVAAVISFCMENNKLSDEREECETTT